MENSLKKVIIERWQLIGSLHSHNSEISSLYRVNAELSASGVTTPLGVSIE